MSARNSSFSAKKTAVALAAVLLASAASAVDLISNLIRCGEGMTPYVVLSGEERTSGKFYGYRNAATGPGDSAFTDSKEWADAHNTPLVVVYDSGGGNSNTFTADLNDDEDYQGGRYLLQWMNGKAGPSNLNCMFVYFKGQPTSPPACRDAYEFCVQYGASSFPCVVCYWKWPDGTIRTSATSGLSSVGSFEGSVNNFLAKNKPPVTPTPTPTPGEKETAGDAAFGCGRTTGARLEAMPSTAKVYVPLTKTNHVNAVTTNLLVVVNPNKSAVTNTVEWASGKKSMEYLLEFGKGGVTNWTANASVKLELRDAGGVLNSTNAVAFVAEAAASPTFPKWVGEDFGYGEWTFDLAAAKEKAKNARQGKAAYTLAFVGGALWETNTIQCAATLMGSGAVAEWARSNNVSLVAVDLPSSGTTASMVTHDPSGGKDAKSGSYYLSRKGLTAAQGLSQLASMTNAAASIAAGGDMPAIVLLKGDGSVAGRLAESRVKNAKVKPAQEEYSLDENIARLNDLLKLAMRTGTEPQSVAYDKTGSGRIYSTTLQVNDSERKYEVTGLPADTYFDLDIDVPDAASAAGFKAELMALAPSGKWTAVVPAKRNTWILNRNDLATNKYYLVFSSYPDPRYEVYGPDTDFTVGFRFSPMQPDPGKIGFREATRKITEGSATGVDIVVERTEWHSGAVEAFLTLIEGEGGTTAKPYRFSWPTNESGAYASVRFDWKNGELGAKTFTLPLNNDEIWDGDERIVVMLSGESEYYMGYIDYGERKYTLTIVEDDSKSSGKIGFSSSAPQASPQTKAGVFYAKENTDVTLGVERTGGASGSASVKVAATAGTVRTERLSWVDKDPETVKYATVTAPSLKAGQRQATFYASLVREGDVQLVPSASRVQVRVLPADAPEFETPRVSVGGFQTQAVLEWIPLAGEIPEGATVTLSRSAGSVPAGVVVEYDQELNALVVSGVPTKDGVFSATYQLVVRSGGKTTYSMPVTIDFTLGAIASANPFLAKARVFTDLPVVDTNANRLVGLVDVTLPVNGRLSARFRPATGGTVPMTAAGWETLEANTDAIAYFASKSGAVLAFYVSGTGEVTALLYDPTVDDDYLVERPAGETWSAEKTADGYQGSYSVGLVPVAADGAAPAGAALCAGAASLSLRMSGVSALRSGKMTFAGTLPNGRTISGTAALTEASDASSAFLPILSTSTADTLAGVLVVTNGSHLTATTYAQQAVRGAEDCAFVWEHAERNKPAEYSYVSEFDARGSYIPSGLNWESQWKRDCGTATLAFSIPGVQGTSALSASGKTVKVAGSPANQLGVAVGSFNAATGALRGTAKVDGGTVSWCGALVPGWGREMMQGAFWRSESGVKTGGGVTLDAAE